MSTDGAAVDTGTISSGSAPNSAPSSPKNRVKFLCSHGGKILPRPADGHLKYVGGETRVISVPRNIPYQQLMKKLTYQIDGEMILKYQVVSEDLDALVSVKSDEDLCHMFDESNRYENAGIPRLRAFLFPVNPIVMESQTGSVDTHALEQRYIDAINGIVRSTPNTIKQRPTINAVQHGSLVSSGCSSPRSPDSCTTEAINNDAMHQGNFYSSRMNMHKVQSSPSICTMNITQQSNHYVQLSPQYVHLYPSYQSPKLPIDLQKSVLPERLMTVKSVGWAEGLRYQMDHSPPHYYMSRQNRGNGCCAKSMHYEDCSHFSDRRMMERTGSVGMRPVCSSPRLGHSGIKAWDGTLGEDI
ncbi:hypothetical protein CDL12_19865 [Handroanthus impetiginosus]|uniref:PB1 domain-containing protein n=1 Tax=Handroanthus impetiginosus TaxID=429701 RepID=A0A2G9GQI4_9LAMI|nr:hypothetical protein CDL12_19865 [Handroanthus impetiginosus]